MALDTKEDRGGNGSEAAAPRVALDGDLVNSYLQLQVRWLSMQLEAARKEAAASRDDAALAVTTVRLWQQATPTALIVLLLGGAVAVLAALTWNDLWRGLSTGQPDNLMFVTSQSTNLSGGVRAVGDFMKEWKDVLLGIAGGGVLLGFKRLAYRSVRSAVVIALAILVSFSLLAALVITDIHLVQNELTPMHVTWRGWSLLGLAVVVGVVLLNELCDIAHSSPASFTARSQLSSGLGRWVSYVRSSTGLGRLLAWLATPHGWLRWLLSVGVVTAISIVLCIPPVIGTVASGSDLWLIAFAATLPLGPVWWLLLLAVVASSPTAREPSAGRLPFAIFAATPVLALAIFVAILLSPGVYDPSGSLNVGLAVVAVLTMEIWAFWFLWAGIALTTPLRIVFLPVVLSCAATIPMYYGLLPFLGLVAILSVGVPWSLWRSRPALVVA